MAYIRIPEELISTITQLKRQALTREDGESGVEVEGDAVWVSRWLESATRPT